VPSRDPAVKVEPSRLQILIAFATISLFGFGGVLAWSRRMMVDDRRWMTAEEFNDLYALCNFLPGPNIVNFSAVFGGRIGGVAGALSALIGLLGPPFAVVLGIGTLYAYFGAVDALRRMFAAVAAAAAGLLISTIIKMLAPLMRERFGASHVTMAAVFVAIGVLRWPLHWVLAAAIPVSIALAWWWGRR